MEKLINKFLLKKYYGLYFKKKKKKSYGDNVLFIIYNLIVTVGQRDSNPRHFHWKYHGVPIELQNF